jgi:Sec23/Sec24 zinc finger/Sec23/Sec24 trunk domain
MRGNRRCKYGAGDDPKARRMDDRHPAFRRRGGDGAVFSARKCPSGPDEACDLPFGFVWTPLSPSLTTTMSSPILCLQCLTYLNLYATIEESTGRWTCPLCLFQNVAPLEYVSASNIPATLVSPMVEYRQILESKELELTYILIMDINLPTNEAHAVANAFSKVILSSNNEIEVKQQYKRHKIALVTFGSSVSIYQLGMTPGLVSAHTIPVQDAQCETYDSAYDIRTKLRSSVSSRMFWADLETEEDLATFHSCISAIFGPPEEYTIPRKEMLKRKKEARKIHSILSINPTSTTTNKVESPWTRSTTRQRPSRCTAEAIQFAMDILDLTYNKEATRVSRTFLFTNGCPNLGSGNIVRSDNSISKVNRAAPDIIDNAAMQEVVPYFETIGREMDGSIDVFLSGAALLGLQAYQALVDPSGGYALPHDTFASEQLESNLHFIICQTKVNRSVTLDLSQSMNGCIADIRMPSYFVPSHVVGAMEVLPPEEDILPFDRSSFCTGAALAANHGIATSILPSRSYIERTLTRVRIGRYDPLSTLSMMLTMDDSIRINESYAFFQCTVRYLDEDGKTLVTRVSSHRLPFARNVHDFLDSMDEEVVPILLGKEAVFRSIVGREDDDAIDAFVPDDDRAERLAYEAQRDLDNTIHRVSGAYRLIGLEVGTNHRDFMEEGGVSSAHSSLGFAFPPELADALHRLFHLRRGPMLSPGPVQSMDDRAEIRNLFLRFPLDDCLCMMAPSLWSSGILDSTTGIILDPIPSDTMTLWDNVSLQFSIKMCCTLI